MLSAKKLVLYWQVPPYSPLECTSICIARKLPLCQARRLSTGGKMNVTCKANFCIWTTTEQKTISSIFQFTQRLNDTENPDRIEFYVLNDLPCFNCFCKSGEDKLLSQQLFFLHGINFSGNMTGGRKK